MRIRGKIDKVAIAAVVAVSTFGMCSPLFAQERRAPPTIVVYEVASRDWMAEGQRFADILGMHGSFSQYFLIPFNGHCAILFRLPVKRDC